MKNWSLRIIVVLFLTLTSTSTWGAVVMFNLDGVAGNGLLGGNENPAVAGGGSGGVGGGGISYDTDTNMLSLDLDWGSGNGFTDLTGPVTGAHIHDSTGPAPSGFTLNGGVKYDLSGFLNASASAGGISGNVAINQVDESDLLAGHFYVNVHTATNGAGEIRGQLTVVPEPGVFAALTGLICIGFGWARRKLAA